MAGAQISARAGWLICWRGEEGEAGEAGGKAGEERRGRRQGLEKGQKREDRKVKAVRKAEAEEPRRFLKGKGTAKKRKVSRQGYITQLSACRHKSYSTVRR